MELHIDLECPQGKDDLKIPTPTLTWNVHKDKMIPTPVELHIDLDFPQGSDDIKIPTPTLAWNVHKDKMISKFRPPWNFTVICIVHKDKIISNSHPHGTSH